MSEHILKFWSEQADKHGADHSASWGDYHMINLEIEAIGEHIHAGLDVLDVGCANGYSTFHQIERNPDSITGIDFSESMIREANKLRAEHPARERLRFELGNAKAIDFEDNRFDVVYTTRTLINLPTWGEQKQAVSECVRVCKPGGKVILSEAFWEPLTLLNAMRTLVNLPPLVEHDFNRYFKKSYLEAFITEQQWTFEALDISSIYYLGSRFLRELVTNPEDYPGYSNPINKIFHDIEQQYSGGGFGIQQIYIIHKPAA